MGTFVIIDNQHTIYAQSRTMNGTFDMPKRTEYRNDALVAEVLAIKRRQQEDEARSRCGTACFVDDACSPPHPLLPLPYTGKR